MRGYCIILGAVALAACVTDRSDPVAPNLAGGSSLNVPISASTSGPATPPFNDEIILRDATGAGGFGHVKFRQPKDGDVIIYLDTWVRDLAPNASYWLQRAVDTNVDDNCTSTTWLTLGLGTTPQAIVTDDRGTGRAALWRALAVSNIGTTFDIHFRVIDAAGAMVLESACYQYVVSQ
jgi:hypothetical protein